MRRSLRRKRVRADAAIARVYRDGEATENRASSGACRQPADIHRRSPLPSASKRARDRLSIHNRHPQRSLVFASSRCLDMVVHGIHRARYCPGFEPHGSDFAVRRNRRAVRCESAGRGNHPGALRDRVGSAEPGRSIEPVVQIGVGVFLHFVGHTGKLFSLEAHLDCESP
jgi:hypothetical protein